MKPFALPFPYLISRYFILIIFITLSISGCSSTSRFNNEKKKITRKSRLTDNKPGTQVRVLLEQASGEYNLTFNDKVLLKDGNDEIASSGMKEKFLVYTENDNLFVKLNRNTFKVRELNIIPAGENKLEFNGRTYCGSIRISVTNSKIYITNITSLEDYVAGVVCSELGTKYGEKEIEAVKAFSVCVRNYTLAKLNENKDIYDVYSDVRDQLFKGSIKAPAVMENAIQLTRGKIIKYNDEPAIVFYHSSCGGYTENCSNVFSTKPRPYLEGVKDGDSPYCKISPNFSWTEEYSGKEIIALLMKAGYLDNNFYRITSVEIKDKFKSGRVSSMVITAHSDNGNEKIINVDGYTIRNIFKTKKTNGILRSNFFDINPVFTGGELERLTITGKGNGHGVGFCQWGAIAQSRAGKNYQEILSFYFPGTHLEDIK